MKIIICGANGRMGRELIIASSADKNFTLVGGIVRNNHLPARDLGDIANLPTLNITASTDLEKIIHDCNAVIDFSLPESSMDFAAITAKHRKIYISGVTGYSDDQASKLRALGKHAVILHSANMSLAINILLKLASMAAKYLPDYDIDLIDTHHNRKLDAPSGTAKMIFSAVEKTIPDKGIMVSSIRTGDYVGEHSLRFSGDFESITLTHHAHARTVFATGALKACLWAAKQPNGFYTMEDMLK